MSFNSVEEILNSIVKWEEDFDQFYAMMGDYLTDSRSRKVAEILQERHERVLKELESIEPSNYRSVEFVKYVPPYADGERLEINPNADLDEVFDQILHHEARRVDYFKRLKEIVVFEKSKDLFQVMIDLKVKQIKETKALLDGADLVI